MRATLSTSAEARSCRATCRRRARSAARTRSRGPSSSCLSLPSRRCMALCTAPPKSSSGSSPNGGDSMGCKGCRKGKGGREGQGGRAEGERDARGTVGSRRLGVWRCGAWVMRKHGGAQASFHDIHVLPTRSNKVCSHARSLAPPCAQLAAQIGSLLSPSPAVCVCVRACVCVCVLS